MDKKTLQERIKQFVAKKLKEESGFAAGQGFQHTGKKVKNETTNYEKPPKNNKDLPAVFTPGSKDLSAYKNMGYREVKPSEMIDAKYLWAGKGGLNETRYSQFKRQTEVIKPSSQMHIAMKEIKNRLREVNKIAEYTSKLKAELSETNDVQYKKRTEEMLSKLQEEVISLYKNIKNLKNG